MVSFYENWPMDRLFLSLLSGESHQTLNKNMAVMGESHRSWKQNGEAQTPITAESAKKGKSSSTVDDSDSDADKFWLQTNDLNLSPTRATDRRARHDPLLDEVAH